MLRRAPSLLAAVKPTLPAATNLAQASFPHLSHAFLHHARAAGDVRHLLDGTPRGTWASSIVRVLHSVSLKSGAVLDLPVRTSLLVAYARNGTDVRAALALFDEAANPDLILWNAVVGALTRSCRYDDAVVFF